MIKVKIIKNWDYPDLLRQTPGKTGIWNQVKFVEKDTQIYDYVIVSNYSNGKTDVYCSRNNLWCVLQEPPNEYFKPFHKAAGVYSLVFTQDESLTGKRYVQSQPALPWHVNKTYDELSNIQIPPKPKRLSFITTNKNNFQGHRDRMKFLSNIADKVSFDLFGKGFREIADKWEGLAPYKYSFAIENFSCRNYWSEKIADCFLSYTVPIYYGCTNISDYFPEGSYISIDIKQVDTPAYINKIIAGDSWEKRLKALKRARDLVLNKYQFFPYFTGKIREWEKKSIKSPKVGITIPKADTYLFNLKNKLFRGFNDL